MIHKYCFACGAIAYLARARPVTSKSKVVRPGSGCSICVGVSKIKWVCPEVGVAAISFLYFLALICVCNHIPRPEHFEIMKVGSMKMWLLEYIGLAQQHFELSCTGLLVVTQ